MEEELLGMGVVVVAMAPPCLKSAFACKNNLCADVLVVECVGRVSLVGVNGDCRSMKRKGAKGRRRGRERERKERASVGWSG